MYISQKNSSYSCEYQASMLSLINQHLKREEITLGSTYYYKRCQSDLSAIMPIGAMQDYNTFQESHCQKFIHIYS